MATRVTAQSANAALEIDGANVGWLSSVEPAPLEMIPDAATRGQRRLKLGEFKASQSVSGAGGLLDWALSVLRPAPVAANGAVVLADANFQARRRIDFTGSHITEVRFPALDASLKQAFSVDVKWQPTTMAFSKATGAVLLPKAGKRKAWMCANFRVGGLPFDARFVTKVQLPTITTQLSAASGRKKAGVASVSLGEVVIEVAASGIDGALDYVNKVADDGLLTDAEFFDFSIELLDPSLSKTLATLVFGGCGLLRALSPKEGSASEAIKKFTLGFSVERFDLKVA